eukprot:355690-Chlamydomonas_euryale.AAC.6
MPRCVVFSIPAARPPPVEWSSQGRPAPTPWHGHMRCTVPVMEDGGLPCLNEKLEKTEVFGACQWA